MQRARANKRAQEESDEEESDEEEPDEEDADEESVEEEASDPNGILLAVVFVHITWMFIAYSSPLLTHQRIALSAN